MSQRAMITHRYIPQVSDNIPIQMLGLHFESALFLSISKHMEGPTELQQKYAVF